MRKKISSTIFVLAILIVGGLSNSSLNAQGTLYVSNLGQTPTGGAQIGSDSWIAQPFFLGYATDSTSNILNSVQLLLNSASGSPAGFSVSIYASVNNGPPANRLGTLSGPSDPTASGVYTYATPGITILPGKAYFVVVTAATPMAQGAYGWSAANGLTQTPGTGWIIDDAYLTSANGSTWTEHIRQNVFQMAIYATPVPEPSAAYLIVLAGGVLLCTLACWRRWYCC